MIEKVGLLTFRGGRFLMCRKSRGTSRLIFPGGKVEPDETVMACLHRELREELGDVRAVNLSPVGTYEDIAHSDDPSSRKRLRIKLFKGDLVGEPAPSSEIVELVWFGPDTDPKEMTPILSRKVLPSLREKGLIDW